MAGLKHQACRVRDLVPAAFASRVASTAAFRSRESLPRAAMLGLVCLPSREPSRQIFLRVVSFLIAAPPWAFIGDSEFGNARAQTRMSAMPSSPSPLMPIECPLCPRCRTRMMLVLLARISPAPDHKEKRMFDCPKCNFIDTVTVLDPLKSESTGWLSSELRPPE
jgi:hypothetical protein